MKYKIGDLLVTKFAFKYATQKYDFVETNKNKVFLIIDIIEEIGYKVAIIDVLSQETGFKSTWCESNIQERFLKIDV